MVEPVQGSSYDRWPVPPKVRAAINRFWWFVPLLLCAASIVFCVVPFLYGTRHTIESVTFGDNYTITIWEESDGVADPSWDPDHCCRDIYYKVEQAERTVIPQIYLTTYVRKHPYDIRTVFAEDGTLVCIYDTEGWRRGIFVIFDTTHPEDQWSIGITPSEGRQSWIERYNRLKKENPDLPPYYN